MIIQCGHCGAPLDVEPRHTVFTCRYCKTKNERERTRTIAETTPKDFAPPKVWRPPAEFAADSATELKYQPNKGGGGCVLLGILGVVLVPIAIGIFGAAGGFDTGESTIAALELNRTVKQLDDDADGKPNDDSLWVAMRSSRFQNINFQWDHAHPEHVKTVTLSGKRFDPDVRAALSKALPGGLDADGHWRWEKTSLDYNKESGLIYADAEPDEGKNLVWKEQMDALWKIIVLACFGKGEEPTLDEKRRFLGAGYPFKDLVKITPAITVDKAVVETRKIFPGAAQTGDIELVVGIDHPLFSRAYLSWHNERGATLYEGRFTAAGGEPSFAPHRERVVQCLSKAISAPTVSDTDFLKNKRNYQFLVTNEVHLWVYDDHIMVIGYGKLDGATWKMAVDAMAGCTG